MKKPNFLSLNPASILFAVNAIIALCIAWGAHWSPGTTGIVDGVITAAITLVTVAMTRPISLQLVAGAATALITALAPFGLHLTTDQLSSGAVVLSLVLAGVFHLAHYPYVAWKRGTSADELARGTAGTTPAV
jgi:hypothetical protein